MYFACYFHTEKLRFSSWRNQAGIEPASAGLRKQARKPRNNFKTPFCKQLNRTAPQRERFDTHDLRGFAETKTNRAPPQREHVDTHDPRRGFIRAPQKRRKKNSSFCTSTTPSPQRVHPRNAKTQKKPRVFVPRPPQRAARALQESQKTSSFSTLTTPIPADRSSAHRKKPRIFEPRIFDHANRGSRGQIRNRVFAPRPRRSPQRVANPIDDQSPAPAP